MAFNWYHKWDVQSSTEVSGKTQKWVWIRIMLSDGWREETALFEVIYKIAVLKKSKSTERLNLSDGEE